MQMIRKPYTPIIWLGICCCLEIAAYYIFDIGENLGWQNVFLNLSPMLLLGPAIETLIILLLLTNPVRFLTDFWRNIFVGLLIVLLVTQLPLLPCLFTFDGTPVQDFMSELTGYMVLFVCLVRSWLIYVFLSKSITNDLERKTEQA
jgi:hypothetical protein